MGLGVRNGYPYILTNKNIKDYRTSRCNSDRSKGTSMQFMDNKSSNQCEIREAYELLWHEQISEFFSHVTLTSNRNNVNEAYRELALLIDKQMGVIHPYFSELSKAMLIWLELWEENNNGSGMKYTPKLSSIGPKYEDSTCAVLTLANNDHKFLPIWLRYYMRHVHDEDIYILDYNTTDGSTSMNLPLHINIIHLEMKPSITNVITEAIDKESKLEYIMFYQKRLLQAGYKCVLYTAVDEYLIPDPNKFPNGLIQYLNHFIYDHSINVVSIPRYEIIPKNISDEFTSAEQDLDWDKSLLYQRYFWFRNAHPNKIHLTKAINVEIKPKFDESIRLLQFTYADARYCLAKAYYDYFIESKYSTSYTIHDFIAPGRLCRSAFYELLKLLPLNREFIQMNSINIHFVLSDRIDKFDLIFEKIPLDWSLVEL